MLPVHVSTVRLFLHIIGATIWVGGQFALAALVPVVRAHGGREATRDVARRFQLVAWPAFALLVATGVWNLIEADVSDRSSDYVRSLFVKLVLVAISGMGAAAHTLLSRTRPALGGMLAALALLAALAATFVGVMLGSGG